MLNNHFPLRQVTTVDSTEDGMQTGEYTDVYTEYT